jgi:putative DNA primase/helicase
MSTDEPDTDGTDPHGQAPTNGDDAAADQYITDPAFDGTPESVQQHYQRARPVYQRFADLDGAPTTGFFGNSGWYRTTVDSNDDGEAVMHRRAYTFEEDYDRLVGSIERNDDDSSWRSAYNIVSWKDSDTVYGGITVDIKSELGQGDGLAGYKAMRGFPLWVDLDLRDNDDGADGPNYKRRRGNLDERVRATVERAYQAYAEEFAQLCGTDTDHIAVFDSGGGGYLYTPAAVTLPIADQYKNDQDSGGNARKLIFNELRRRFFAYGTGAAVNQHAGDYGFEGIQTRVNEKVDGAADFLDPDWMQNRNRQSKAPLAIHGDHDVIVTPARPMSEPSAISYEPTLVSDLSEALIEHTAREAEKVVRVPADDVLEDWTEQLIATLFPQSDADGWRDTLDQWLAEQRRRKRDRIHQRAREDRRQHQRLQERVDDASPARPEPDSHDRKNPHELLTEIDVTPVRKDVLDVLDGATVDGRQFATRPDVRQWWEDDDDELIVDVRDVIREYAADEWRTADRGHEVTFRPSWRDSDSGKSCAVPWIDEDPDTGEISVGNVLIDNGVEGASQRCGPVKAYALGTGILPTAEDPDKTDRENAAAEALSGKQWADAVDGLRADGYEIPMYVPEAGSPKQDGETYDKTPLWGLRKAARALDVCSRDDFVEHETDDGDSYLGFDAPTYNAVLRALEDAGIDHGREPIDTDARSQYYDLPLEEFVDGDGDPWTEPETMLRACLRAREGGAISEHAAPPTLALLPLRRDMLNQSASRDMTDATESLLEDLYHELTLDELDGIGGD